MVALNGVHFGILLFSCSLIILCWGICPTDKPIHAQHGVPYIGNGTIV